MSELLHYKCPKVRADHATGNGQDLDYEATTKAKRPRLGPRCRMSPDSYRRLACVFELEQYPNAELRSALADELGVPVKRISTWFNNKRASVRKQLKAHYAARPTPDTANDQHSLGGTSNQLHHTLKTTASPKRNNCPVTASSANEPMKPLDLRKLSKPSEEKYTSSCTMTGSNFTTAPFTPLSLEGAYQTWNEVTSHSASGLRLPHILPGSSNFGHPMFQPWC